ncbi:hypothetical protein ACIQKB_20040 [Streptomyces sp. NPDC092046]|uniref:hypothetical protein n=1 Tax=Streptomyces sp. NPDC092046 TaxID=3366009 RepID=UPI003811AE47
MDVVVDVVADLPSDVVADLPADPQVAEPVQVGECSLHEPALRARARALTGGTA